MPLLLFLWLHCCTTYFVHTHQVDGIRITHSHPGSSQHQHTYDSLVTIQHLSHLCVTGVTAFIADVLMLFLLCTLLPDRRLSFYRERHMALPLLRGPPTTFRLS